MWKKRKQKKERERAGGRKERAEGENGESEAFWSCCREYERGEDCRKEVRVSEVREGRLSNAEVQLEEGGSRSKIEFERVGGLAGYRGLFRVVLVNCAVVFVTVQRRLRRSEGAGAEEDEVPPPSPMKLRGRSPLAREGV
jgi:hypothetical protein